LLASLVIAMLIMVLGTIHFVVRNKVARRIARGMSRADGPGHMGAAFLKSTKYIHSIFKPAPVGWGRGSRKLIEKVRSAADKYVQTMNDKFTDPSGSVERDT
jgi:hypothetical protein